MRDLYGVRVTLQRAKELISDPDNRNLAYAALEFRFCMEAIAYRQLDGYGPEIKSQLMNVWNPSRIIRMLTLFDEHSDQSAEFSISVDLPDGHPLLSGEAGVELDTGEDGRRYLSIGKANRIPWKKFQKAYSSLGSFLHLGRDGEQLLPSREKLREIVALLEEVADSSIIAALNVCATATCACGTLLVLGPKQQAGQELIYCTNSKCKEVFKADTQKPGAMVRVKQVLLTCPCGSKVLFQAHSMLAMERCDDCGSSVRAAILAELNVVSEAY